MYVLRDEHCNETLQSLDVYGWNYVLYLYNYIQMQNSVKAAWEEHHALQNKK